VSDIKKHCVQDKAFGKCTLLKSIATVSHSPDMSMAFAYHCPIRPTTC